MGNLQEVNFYNDVWMVRHLPAEIEEAIDVGIGKGVGRMCVGLGGRREGHVDGPGAIVFIATACNGTVYGILGVGELGS